MLELLEDRLAPATATWIGGSGDWDTAANWSGATGPGGLPGPNDNVVINAGASVTHNDDNSDSVLSITAMAPITLSAGTLTVGTVSVPGSFSDDTSTNSNDAVTLSGGTLADANITAGTTVAVVGSAAGSGLTAVTLTGILALNGQYADVTVNQGLTLNGGTVQFNNTLTGMSFAGSGTQTLGGNGQVIFASGSNEGFDSSGGPLVVATGISVTDADAGATVGSSSEPLTLDGTVTVSAGTLTVTGSPVTNNGPGNGTASLQANGGTLIVTNLQSNPGGTAASGGATLTLNGAWHNTGTISENAATINLGGTFTTADIGTLSTTDGNVDITGTLTNTGTLTVGADGSAWSIGAGGVIVGGEVSVVSGAELTATGSPNFANNPAFTGVTLAGTLALNNNYVTVTVNQGLTLDGGTVQFNNSQDGMTLVGSGTQTLGTVTGTTGQVIFAAGTNDGLDSSAGPLVLGPGISVTDTGGSGTVGSTTEPLTLDGSVTASGGQPMTVTGSSVTNNGTLEATTGASLTVNPTTLTNFSSGTLTGGTWEAEQGGALRLIGANITTNAATILIDGASSHIYNAAGNTTSALASFAANAAGGSFTTQNGANLATTQAFTNAGTITIGANSAFTLGGHTYTQTGGTTILAGGTLGGANDPSVIQQGTLSGPGTVGGNLTNQGEVDLGASTGTLAVLGTYNQNVDRHVDRQGRRHGDGGLR